MIIDVIQNMSNSLIVTDKAVGSSTKLQLASDKVSDFTLFQGTDSFIWKLDKTPSSAILDISFPKTVKFQSMSWSMVSSLLPTVTLQYSYDDFTFREFEYFSYIVANNAVIPAELRDIVALFEGRIIRILTLKGKTAQYIPFDPNTNKVSSYDSAKLSKLRDFIEPFRVIGDNSVVSCHYQFQYFDKYQNDDMNLYDKGFKSIRFLLKNITDVVTMRNLQIMAEASVTVEKIDISLLTDNYFGPAYFTDNTFIPSMAETFFQMLSQKSVD